MNFKSNSQLQLLLNKYVKGFSILNGLEFRHAHHTAIRPAGQKMWPVEAFYLARKAHNFAYLAPLKTSFEKLENM